MALSAARFLTFEGQPEYTELEAAASDTYYRGAVLIKDANGYASVPTDTAALFAAGVFTGKAEGGVSDDAYVVASGSTPKLRLAKGKVWLPFSGAVQSDVGEIFYLSDDGTLTQTAGSKTVGYVAQAFKTGYVLIDLRAPDRIA